MLIRFFRARVSPEMGQPRPSPSFTDSKASFTSREFIWWLRPRSSDALKPHLPPVVIVVLGAPSAQNVASVAGNVLQDHGSLDSN